MKHIITRFSLFLVIAGLGFSCSKKIDEAYRNPNADVRVPVESLLPQIIAAMAGNYAGHGTMNDMRYVGAYVQNWQYFQPLSQFDRMGYINSIADVAQSTWRMHYYDIGQNNMQMIRWAEEENKWDYVGAGKAIFAWSWLVLTDYYGDVILKEAFNTDLITFHYDTQPEVYDYVRQLCFEALDAFNKAPSGGTLAQGDAYFLNGNIDKWKKFTYGVLARRYNHIIHKNPAFRDSVIHYANLSINTNADNASVKFAATNLSATNSYFGPFRGNLVVTSTPAALRQSDYIARLMTGFNSAFPDVEDPRAWYMLYENANGTIKGVRPNKGQFELAQADRPDNLYSVSQNNTGGSNVAPSVDTAKFIFKNDAPFPIMTAAEVQFMKAEAYYLKGDKAAALNAYRDGISLHFDMLTETYNRNIPAGKEITPAIKAAYMNNTTVIPASAANLTLNKIMLQKYIAMWGHGILETWVDMRRFHYIDTESGVQVYTDFTPPSGTDLFPDNQGKLVYRMRPRFNSEYVWNINELQRIGATTNDYHTKEMWFSMP